MAGHEPEANPLGDVHVSERIDHQRFLNRSLSTCAAARGYPQLSQDGPGSEASEYGSAKIVQELALPRAGSAVDLFICDLAVSCPTW